MPFLVDRALCQRDHRTTVMALWGALGSVLCVPQALGVQWESQADRLQNISATLIDALPVLLTPDRKRSRTPFPIRSAAA